MFDGRDGRGTDFHVDLVDALARGDSAAARLALQSDIGRSFDLVMNHDAIWHRRDGAA
jgi:DNA-binding GntR family transcriptional regulator